MLLPEHALGIKRGNGGRVVLAPSALQHICPLLGFFSCVHAPRVDMGADRLAAQLVGMTSIPHSHAAERMND